MRLLKYLAAVLLVSFAASCAGIEDPLADDKKPADGGSETPKDTVDVQEAALVLSFDRRIIHANGEDAATLTVLYNGEPVTGGYTIFDAEGNEVVLTGSKFVTETVGTHVFWAYYQAAVSEEVSVRAVSVPVPAAPADPRAESTSFVRRVLMTQITGTDCGYCPKMIKAMASVMGESEYAEKAVLAVSHQFNASDPAYQSATLMGQGGAPYLYFDLVANPFITLKTGDSEGAVAQRISQFINEYYALVAPKAGISVNSVVDGNTVIFKATVKAAVKGEYRVGAWLLEDGIVAEQKDYSIGTDGKYKETHNNCVRIVDSRFTASRFTGHRLGEIEAGETAEYLFAWDLDANPEDPEMTWNLTSEAGYKLYGKCLKPNLAKCRLLVFVFDPSTNSVNNVITCPISGETPFEYTE